MMEIKQYEILINEKNKVCGLCINLNHYALSDFLKKNLQYNIEPHKKEVFVYDKDNKNDKIVFKNITIESIPYFYSTPTLALLGGRDNKENKIEIISEAILE